MGEFEKKFSNRHKLAVTQCIVERAQLSLYIFRNESFCHEKQFLTEGVPKESVFHAVDNDQIDLAYRIAYLPL
jgi:hypothetical protein